LIVALLFAVFVVAVFANYFRILPIVRYQKGTPQPSTFPSAMPTLTPRPITSPSILSSFTPGFPVLPPPSTSQPITLYPGEVKDYNGTPLSSIGNVYENAIAGTQFIDVSTYHLNVTGLVNKTVELTYDDVITKHQLYQKVVSIYCVEGWSATILWEGVLVKDLIADAGAKTGANTVVFYASDGYTTSLPLDYIVNNNIILAYKMNNLTIPPERGFPFELVAQSMYGYKWIKWVMGIELSNDASYLGYWESRGYPNNATIP
jgi:DMSO/TMAO reductase YedYZ molybdopterin-dependent catalytic subunit